MASPSTRPAIRSPTTPWICVARRMPCYWAQLAAPSGVIPRRRFGRNKVCSNIIFGLGETDETVLNGVRALAGMGAVATLRAIRVSALNRGDLDRTLGKLRPVTAGRMLNLAREQKTILQDHGLSPLGFKTMCHACLACDIVPFWDV